MEFTIQVTVINFHSFYDRTNKYFTKQAYQRHNIRLLIIYLALQREIENNKKKIYNYSDIASLFKYHVRKSCENRHRSFV